MTITAKRPVQLGGHIFRKGESREWNGPVDSRIAANFTAADGTPLTVGGEAPAKTDAPTQAIRIDAELLIQNTIDALKRKGITQQLDAMNITYSPSSTTKYLAKLLLMSKGEIKEA